MSFMKGKKNVINKSCYYCGALIAHLLTNKITNTAPVLCDESKDSKSLSFLTDNGEYNLYIKYSTKFNRTKKRNEEYRKCQFTFSNQEIERIKTYTAQKQNVYLTFICTNSGLNETEIAFVEIEKALEILGFDEINDRKNLYVKHIKGKEHLMIWGTMLDKENAYKIPKDFNVFFKKK